MRVPEQQPNTATFEELAIPLFDQLYNFAQWLTQDRSEAEDLVQETFTKALRGFSSFRAGTNFRAWIYRILRNSFLSSRTGLKTMVALDEESAARIGSGGSHARDSADRAGQSRNGAAGVGEIAGAVPRDIAALRSGRDVLPGNFRDAIDSDGHGDVSVVSRAQGAAYRFTG